MPGVACRAVAACGAGARWGQWVVSSVVTLVSNFKAVGRVFLPAEFFELKSSR